MEKKQKKSARTQPGLDADLEKLKRALRTETKARIRPAGAAEGEGPARKASEEALQKDYEDLRNRLSKELQRLDQMAEEAGLTTEPAEVPFSGPEPEPAGGIAFDATAAEASASKIDTGFSDFLSEVGKAMVEAQNKLDEQTRNYLEGTAAQAMPTMFRLPRLNASIKFELQKKGAQGLNFIVYRDTTERTESRQHSLEFEIVAAPPPPGFLPIVPPWRVLSGAERSEQIGNLGAKDTAVIWELTGTDGRRSWLTATCSAAGEPRSINVSLFGPDKNVVFSQQVKEGSPPGGSTSFVAQVFDLAAKQQGLNG